MMKTILNSVIAYKNEYEEIFDLERVIIELDTLYENGEECICSLIGELVTDNEYDALKKRLFDLKPSHGIFNTVTSSQSNIGGGGKKVFHNPPMTSISKCNGTQAEKENILKKWIDECADGNIDNACMSYKHDGIALSIEYKNGKFHQAGLRSKSGVDGADVSDKARYIKNIPLNLPVKVDCILRGEIETPISVFEKLNEEAEKNNKDIKSNPRAHTAGAMNKKTAEEMKDSGLIFTAYNIFVKNPPYKTEIEKSKFVENVLKIPFVKTIKFTPDRLKIFEDKHRQFDHLIDGVVLSVNDLKKQEELGTHGNSVSANPKGKIAWKFSDEIMQTMVTDIVWGCGRSGNITPVLIINPVQLEGTKVQRVTAHNVGILKQNKIGSGSIIEIIKSGKIIPKLHKVIEAKGKLNIPTNCPSCGSLTKVIDGNNEAQSLVCTNKNSCPAQNIKNLNHWFKILDVKGIAEKNIEKLVNLGMVQKQGDFYRLTVNKLISVGFTERTAVLIVARIWKVNSPENIKDNNNLIEAIKVHSSDKIKAPMSKFFAAFGIGAAGKSAGEILEKEIGNWEKIKTSTTSELEVFDGIGPIVAQEIVRFFHDNKNMIEDVEQYFEFEVKTSSGKLEGKNFCLSGNLEGGKDKWKREIELQGGSVKGSVSKKVDYLICGDGSGNKRSLATDLSIPILTVEDLEKMLN